jgi:polar amino acid transport system permease protein
VILPPALPALLPPVGNFSIEILKGTAIVGFISVRDLTFWGDQIRATTQQYEVVFSIVLVIYFITALGFSALFRFAENMTPLRRIERRVSRMTRR